MQCKETPRLLLRAIEPSDIEFITRMENDGLAGGYTDRVAPLSEQSVRKYVMTVDPDPYASGQLRLLCSTVTGLRVGLVDYYDISALHRHCYLGVIVEPMQRGRGMGTAMIRLATMFAWRRLRMRTVAALVAESNHVSVRAFTAAGYSRSGCLASWWEGLPGPENCMLLQAFARGVTKTKQ